MLLGFADFQSQTEALADSLGLASAMVAVHRFPDGESKVSLPERLPAHVIVCRSLDRPNDKLIELLLTAQTARQLGARRLSLVAPYLCYMRQDMAFHAGEAISQRIVGSFLASLFDDLITVDPHLHRIQHLREAVPLQNSLALSAGAAMGEFLQTRQHPFLLGPDRESLQWVKQIADSCDLDYGVGAKERHGDRDVTVTLPQVPLAGRDVMIIDDVVSSGETVAMAASQCLDQGAARVEVLVTHALFAPGAEARMRDAGVSAIHSTNSITHPSNRLSLTPTLARAIGSLFPGL